ncbi:hypothetical protein ACFFX0_18985 [Citricoccus parietis]|uniref:Uncharacterized protein n=1 Tax=Citricoccus parietis TaxID=592307 RepID=A0ABV5G2L4_9MICC
MITNVLRELVRRHRDLSLDVVDDDVSGHGIQDDLRSGGEEGEVVLDVVDQTLAPGPREGAEFLVKPELLPLHADEIQSR